MLALQWVCHALTETDKAIAEIALACGFAHQGTPDPRPCCRRSGETPAGFGAAPARRSREATSTHDMILCMTVACFVQDGLAPPS